MAQGLASPLHQEFARGCAIKTDGSPSSYIKWSREPGELAKLYAINHDRGGVKQRKAVADRPAGPKKAKSAVPSIEEEATSVGFPVEYAAAARRYL